MDVAAPPLIEYMEGKRWSHTSELCIQREGPLRKTLVLGLHTYEYTHVHVPHTKHSRKQGESHANLTFPCFRQCNLVHMASRVLKPKSLLNGDAVLRGMEPVLATSDGIGSRCLGSLPGGGNAGLL